MSLERAPLYARAEAELRARIVRGEWKPGEALPTEPILAASLGISQGTLRRALAALEQQRLIERRQGIGTRVVEETSERELFHFFRAETVDGSRLQPTSLIHRIERRAARSAEQRALRLTRADRVHHLTRERRLGGRPCLLERISLPEPLFPGFALPTGVELAEELYVHYQRRYAITITRCAERLSAVAAPAPVARILHLPEGTPLLLAERTALDPLGRPVEFRLSWIQTADLRYAIDLR
ncbi:GntR family transcriptional regulator [Roseococcus sp. YIM B11640]|uniref:GntR family transcriptional regulator n=1 Tax=Roseococcus sp. YIM B11640 TaxID=3133973 RepID=UPI003C7AC5A3